MSEQSLWKKILKVSLYFWLSELPSWLLSQQDLEAQSKRGQSSSSEELPELLGRDGGVGNTGGIRMILT